MKTHQARPLRATLCSAFIATCAQVSARSPQPRVESGTIEAVRQDARDQSCCGTIGTIDQDARILRVQRDGEAVPLTLVWNSQTRFIEGTGFVAAAALTKGARVTVSYHTPYWPWPHSFPPGHSSEPENHEGFGRSRTGRNAQYFREDA